MVRVGFAVGLGDGIWLLSLLGALEGCVVGSGVGDALGVPDGTREGDTLETLVGLDEGKRVIGAAERGAGVTGALDGE